MASISIANKLCGTKDLKSKVIEMFAIVKGIRPNRKNIIASLYRKIENFRNFMITFSHNTKAN